MSDEKRGGPGGGPGGGNRNRGPGGGPGGNRDRGPGGGNRGPGGGRDGRKGGGRGGFGKGPAKPERRETYESLQLLTRGEGFHIDKFVLAEKGTHKPVKVEYRLTREGLKGVHNFPRLVDAQTAATAPLPEPEPEVVEEAVTETAEGESAETEGAEGAADSVEHVGEDAPADEPVETPAEDTPAENTDSVEHVPPTEAAG